MTPYGVPVYVALEPVDMRFGYAIFEVIYKGVSVAPKPPRRRMH
jgi:hypothetical protein